VQWLLDHKADPTRLNSSNQTASQIAAKAGNGKTARILREAAGELEPVSVAKPVQAVVGDDPMHGGAKDGWLGSANREAGKAGGGKPRSRSKAGKKKK